MIQVKDRSSKWRRIRWAIFLVVLSVISMSQSVQAVPKLHNYDGSWIEWSRTEENIETGRPK